MGLALKFCIGLLLLGSSARPVTLFRPSMVSGLLDWVNVVVRRIGSSGVFRLLVVMLWCWKLVMAATLACLVTCAGLLIRSAKGTV